MQSTQLQAERTIPAGPGRRAAAEEWLGGVLKQWDVRSASTARWLAPAQETLDSPEELVLLAQYDPGMLLFTIEIWRSGRRVYGIDDWLG